VCANKGFLTVGSDRLRGTYELAIRVFIFVRFVTEYDQNWRSTIAAGRLSIESCLKKKIRHKRLRRRRRLNHARGGGK